MALFQIISRRSVKESKTNEGEDHRQSRAPTGEHWCARILRVSKICRRGAVECLSMPLSLIWAAAFSGSRRKGEAGCRSLGIALKIGYRIPELETSDCVSLAL